MEDELLLLHTKKTYLEIALYYIDQISVREEGDSVFTTTPVELDSLTKVFDERVAKIEAEGNN